MAATDVVRLAASADLHCTRTSQGALQPLFAQVQDRADILLLCGDLTDNGLPEEAMVLVRELAPVVRIPMLGVLGNHEFETGNQGEIQRILAEADIRILDGDTCELQGIGFAGVKGFGGGFGRRALEPWGEDSIKRFVREGVEEALKLESALARLYTPHRIALLHYAPIQATVDGESPEIFPFLGSSRLEEPLNRYAVTAAFHGHAHHGTAEGRTSGNIPVYNVSIKLMQQTQPDRMPFRVLELPRQAPTPSSEGNPHDSQTQVG